MQIFARHELVTGRLDESQPALLLEGSWPTEVDGELRFSLDESILGCHAWIDDDASDMARQIIAATIDVPSLVFLNAVRLRYELVKLLRVVAWCRRIQPLRPGSHVRAVFERDRDEDYGLLLKALADDRKWHLAIRWESNPAGQTFQGNESPLESEWWRRWASNAARWLNVSAKMRRSDESRVLLCGNPRHLDPVCGELVRRRVKAWWLYERFAVGSWLRWRAAGIGQWVCDRPAENIAPLPLGVNEGPLEMHGVDLRAVLTPWLRRKAESFGSYQAQLAAQIEQALDAIRPTAVIVDQDGTPFCRALVQLAKARDIKTVVVQHGVPFVSFGFSPLEADYLCAWGETSRQQFIRWGVPDQRIVVTGSPAHDRTSRTAQSPLAARRSDDRPPHFVFLATVPPADARPDLVAYRCTRSSYEQMLRTAFTVLSEYENATVLVKPHPRDATQRLLHKVLHDYPALDALIVKRGTVEQYLANADCVLSCASSGGVEATLAGVPVVQLMPEGSSDLIDAAEWGLVGTARTADDLRGMIDRALYDPSARPCGLNPSVVGNFARPAAAQIADRVLDRTLPPVDKMRLVGDSPASKAAVVEPFVATPAAS